MSIPVGVTKIRESFTGAKLDFDFPFKVYDDDELLVYAIDTTTTPETKTLLTLGADYSVALSEVTDGGTVTYVDARSSDYDSFIESSVPNKQATTFPSAEAVEIMGDKLCRQIQQLKDASDRTIKLDSATAVTSVTMEDPVDRRALIFERTGDVVVIATSTYDPDTQVATAAASAASAGVSAASASSSAANALASENAAAGYAASINLPTPLATTGALVTVKSTLDGYEFGLVKSIDDTLASNSDTKVATEKAVKTYVDRYKGVVQVVYNETYSAIATTHVISVVGGAPVITDGEALISVAATPKKSGNTFVVSVNAQLSERSNLRGAVTLFVGNTLVAVSTAVLSASCITPVLIRAKYTTVSAAECTFSVRFGPGVPGTADANSVAGSFMGDKIVSSILIEEYE